MSGPFCEKPGYSVSASAVQCFPSLCMPGGAYVQCLLCGVGDTFLQVSTNVSHFELCGPGGVVTATQPVLGMFLKIIYRFLHSCWSLLSYDVCNLQGSSHFVHKQLPLFIPFRLYWPQLFRATCLMFCTRNLA